MNVVVTIACAAAALWTAHLCVMMVFGDRIGEWLMGDGKR